MPPPAYISDIYIQIYIYIYKEITDSESPGAAVDDKAARELNLTHGVTSKICRVQMKIFLVESRSIHIPKKRVAMA